ncbi:Hypothetical predicted protein [Octopus vulgaris]|uniref:Uncharacterized protein n=1 Tax=Octopus vulgaris TaxID=6645 RepID=A0AA36B4W0_OCTVU|nr:Hypothetical predicted protein [Octopus vulgaris]
MVSVYSNCTGCIYHLRHKFNSCIPVPTGDVHTNYFRFWTLTKKEIVSCFWIRLRIHLPSAISFRTIGEVHK